MHAGVSFFRNQIKGYTPNQQKVIVLSSVATIGMIFGIVSIMPVVPKLAEFFQVPLSVASLVIAAYALPGIVLAPVAGLLADRYGRRAVLVPAFLLFSLAGGACALAPNLYVLIGLRFLQGVGAAPLQALNITILGDTFSGPLRARWLGYNMTMVSLCNAIYPALGGALGQLDWRLPFLLPLFALPVAFVTMRTELLRPETAVSFRQYLRQVYSVFSRRTLGYLAVTLCVFFMLFGGIITGYPALARQVFAAEPAVIGSLMVVFSLGSGAVSVLFGRLTLHVSARSLLFASVGLYALGIALLPRMPGLGWLALPLLLFGAGHALNVPCMQALLVQSVTPAERGAFLSVNSMLTRIGQTTGPYIFSRITEWQGLATAFDALLAVPLAILLVTLAAVPGGTLEEHAKQG